MCYTNTDSFKNKVPRKYMDYGLFTKIIDEIGTNVPAIRLSLRGEATLHNEFIECIKYAKSKGIKEVSFLTNASTLTADYFEEILKAGADWITISVDGLGSTYESIRKPLTFDQIITTIKMIKSVKDKYNSHKPVIKIQSIWPAIRENPELFYDTFVEYVDIIAFNPLIDYLSNDSDILYENGFVCPQLYQRLVVGVDGRVMICANDEEGTVIVGDANDQTVHQIWHGKNMNKYRELYKKKDGFMELALCRKCYLPRLTGDYEEAFVHGRKVLINNYVNRKQVVGR